MRQDHAFRSRSRTDPEMSPAVEPGGVDALVPLLYGELRRMAHRQLDRERGDETLQTTALVHEAYLKLAGTGDFGGDRAYFFAAASQAMRQVLVERARRRKALKRGGRRQRITLGEADAATDAFAFDLLALDEALDRLAQRSPRQARVVACRYFGGMNVADTALALGVSKRTVESDWTIARAWLYSVLGDAAEDGRSG